LVTIARDSRSLPAAAAKLPLSTTAQKTFMLVNESMLAVLGTIALNSEGIGTACADRSSPELPPAERPTRVGKSDDAQVQQ
jgi:hypothetical protein